MPVGAVIVDAGGTVVAKGRNRIFDPTGPAAEIANSYVAPADINALAQIPPGEYYQHAMYSTLKRCVMCTRCLGLCEGGLRSLCGD